MITELQKKIMEFSILDADEWVSNPFVNDSMIENRIGVCFDDLKKYWLPTLEERNIAIPESDTEFAELVFAQPDYKSRAEREAKTSEQLLEENKEKKIQELEVAYRAAQWIQVRNGHIFYVPLAGSDWVTIETACLSAYMRGAADLIWQDINGQVQTLKDLPLIEWQKFYNKAKPIGVSNKDIRVRKEVEINNCQTQAELDAVVWTFPAITEVIVDI